MRALLAAVIFLTAFSFNPVQAQTCTDPPTSKLGKCYKQAGARCDPTTRRWIGGNDTAYISCTTGSGQTKTTTDAKGRTVTFRLTGRYSDCIRDSKKLGNSAESAKEYCDGRPGLR
jgi:hypothetical protein